MTPAELYAKIGGDYDAALKILRMDKMIARLIVKLPRDTSCQRLFSAWQQKDAAGVFEGAHALKGVCANLAVTELSAAAAEIADEFRPGHPRSWTDEEADGKIRLLHERYTRAMEEIQAFEAQG